MTHVKENVVRNMGRKTVDVSTAMLLDSCRKRFFRIFTALRTQSTCITVSPVTYEKSPLFTSSSDYKIVRIFLLLHAGHTLPNLNPSVQGVRCHSQRCTLGRYLLYSQFPPLFPCFCSSSFVYKRKAMFLLIKKCKTMK